MVYDARLDVAGNVVVLRRYAEPQRYGRVAEKDDEKKTTKKYRRELTAGERQENQEKAGRRAQKRIVDMVNAAFGFGHRQGPVSVKFVTLTYGGEQTSWEAASQDFRRFVGRLGYYVGERLQYLCVPEIQHHRQEMSGKAVWHFHMIFVSRFIPWSILREIWGLGGVDIRRVQWVHNLGRYVGKYIGKDFDSGRVVGQHRYLASPGLLKDVQVARAEQADGVDVFGEALGFFGSFVQSVHFFSYVGEWTGRVEGVEVVLRPGEDSSLLLTIYVEGFARVVKG